MYQSRTCWIEFGLFHNFEQALGVQKGEPYRLTAAQQVAWPSFFNSISRFCLLSNNFLAPIYPVPVNFVKLT